jgi:hypothetical protein
MLAVFSFGASHLSAATTCAYQSSFQYPLWNDAVSWNLPGLYNSIQLADIDGDGQDELLGYGPFGIEVYHWEPSGEAWLKMPAGTPPFGANDVLMTADVNGDGQAEIIQLSNTGTDYSVDVWHYDPAPGVWELQPQLHLSLSRSDAGTFQSLIKFADMNHSGRKHLVYLQNARSAGIVEPQVYQVNADGSGWASIGGNGMYPSVSAINSNSFFQIGDVTGDGKPDIVVRQALGFLVFSQQSAAAGQVSFTYDYAAPTGVITLPTGFQIPIFLPSPAFTLADLYNTGTKSIVAIPLAGPLTAFKYSPGKLTELGHDITTNKYTVGALPDYEYSTLQAAQTSFNGGDSVLIMGIDDATGLVHFVADPNKQNNLDSNAFTPFMNPKRFGDDVSHYSTIQTGKVRYGLGGALHTILIGRDQGGVHTLVESSNVCETGGYGFQLAQAKYFPVFTGGDAAAYSFISNALVKGNFNIRSLYPNDYAALPAYEATLATLIYPANQSRFPVRSRFSQDNFNNVRLQLNAEFLAASNTVSYFAASNAHVNNLFASEEAALPEILTALSLPADKDLSLQNNSGQIFANILTQVLSTFFFSFGTDDANAEHIGTDSEGANAAAIAISLAATVISDVEQYVPLGSGGGSTLGGQTLIVQNQVTDWHTAANTGMAIAQNTALQNWDLIQALSQQIGEGSLAISSIQEDQAINSALNTFQIQTWKSLAGQSWYIFAGQTTRDLSSYPYEVHGYAKDSLGAQPWDVFVEINGPVKVPTPLQTPTPAAQATMQQLANLGVDYHDVLGQRNGWENTIPYDATIDWFWPGQTWTIPADVPPPATPGPKIGPPATLTIVGGGQESTQTYTCAGLSTAVLRQSTPVNSVFPEPLIFLVQDLAGNGVPGATVQISAPGLFPTTSTVLTDNNGNATATLVANGIVRNDYLASIQVTKPAADPSVSACSLAQQYLLENAPSVKGGEGPTGLTPGYTMKGKSGTAPARVWTINLYDRTQTATAITINSYTLQYDVGKTCTPVISPAQFPIVMDGPDNNGNFTANLTTDFSSCTGLVFFDGLFDATASISLSDGNSYNVPANGTLYRVAP